MNQLGKYRLVAEVARGGMGIVYLAVASGPARFNKLLVIKELKPELVEDDTFLEMFLEEARLAARLSHQNIVQTYEVGAEGKRHYIVMDYLDGVTLARVLRKKKPEFTRNMQLRVICEILQGLHYAHTLTDFDGTPLGIVHRDCTPQNVFLTFDGTAKLVDFGVAKALDSSLETRTGVIKGKPAYMAPEQIAGEIDPRADVFSCGVMIWEAIAGKRLWEKKGDVEVLASILKGEVQSIRDAAPDAPEELYEICEKALKKNRDERYESAQALQDALEKFLASDPTATMREVGRVISDMFSEERTKTRATIEKHLADAKAGATPEKLPSLPPPPGMESRTPAGRRTSSDRMPAVGASSTPSLSTSTSTHPTSGATPISSATPAGSAMHLGDASSASVGPPPQRSSRKGWLLVGLAGAAILAGGFFYGLDARKKDEAPPPTAAGHAPATETAPPPTSTQASAPPTQTAPVATEAPTVAAHASAETKPTTKPEKPATPSRVTWTPPPKAAPPPPPPPKPPVKETPAPETTAKSSEPGFLTIDTYPWTKVTMDGKVLGNTPLVKVQVPPGTHTLVMENPGENVKQTTTITVKAGETVSKRLAF